MGKGLSALIPEVEKDSKNQILDLSIKLIKPNPYQPRKEFDEEHLKELANSIKEKGLIQPILVRKTVSGTYELIAGERRLRASELVGYDFIPAIIKVVKDDVEMLEYALIENTQREDLNPIEEAEAYKQLMVQFNYTQMNLSEKIGKERSTIANIVRLLNLPEEVQLLLKERKLTQGHARALLGLDNKERILLLAKKIVRDKLSVRQVEEIIKEKIEKIEKRFLEKAEAKEDVYMRKLEDILTHSLSAKVRLKVKRKEGKIKKGKIEIEFHSEDDLVHLLEIFNVMPDM